MTGQEHKEGTDYTSTNPGFVCLQNHSHSRLKLAKGLNELKAPPTRESLQVAKGVAPVVRLLVHSAELGPRRTHFALRS